VPTNVRLLRATAQSGAVCGRSVSLRLWPAPAPTAPDGHAHVGWNCCLDVGNLLHLW